MGRLGKRQLLYLTKRLCEVDVDVYVANVTQQVEERESVQLATYEWYVPFAVNSGTRMSLRTFTGR